MIEFDIPDYKRINEELYEKEKRKLLIELVKLQNWIIKSKRKIAFGSLSNCKLLRIGKFLSYPTFDIVLSKFVIWVAKYF